MAACLTGCINLVSDDGAKAFGSVVSSGLKSFGLSVARARELGYVTESFFRKQKRWPATQAELRQYVAESDGYLVLGPCDEIKFTPQDDGSVEVFALLNGASQRITIEQPN